MSVSPETVAPQAAEAQTPTLTAGQRPRRSAAVRAVENINKIHAWESAPERSSMVRAVASAMDSEFRREDSKRARKRRAVRVSSEGAKSFGTPLGVCLPASEGQNPKPVC